MSLHYIYQTNSKYFNQNPATITKKAILKYRLSARDVSSVSFFSSEDNSFSTWAIASAVEDKKERRQFDKMRSSDMRDIGTKIERTILTNSYIVISTHIWFVFCACKR